MADPQLPFFVKWGSPAAMHPSNGADPAFALATLEIAGDPQRVSEWLGETVEAPLEDVKVDWVAPNGTPGILAAQFQTPSGLVRSFARHPVDATPSPNIWHHPATYEIENRAVDPLGRVEAAMGSVASWDGARLLDVGCGTGFHLPRLASTATSVIGVEPHRDLAGWRGGVRASCPASPSRWVRRRPSRSPTRRSTSCTPAGPTSSGRAASRGWSSSTG